MGAEAQRCDATSEESQPRYVPVLLTLAIGVGACLTAGVVLGLVWLGLPALRLGESWAIRIFWIALLLIFGMLTTRAAVSRRVLKALGWSGWFLVTLALGSEVAFGFHGFLRAGEGEPQPPFYEVMVGPWARGGVPPLEYRGPSPADGSLRLSIDGEERAVEMGAKVKLESGYRARVTEAGAAPYFSISDADGNLLHEGYVKLGSAVEDDDFIHVGLLPHRFYFSRVGEPSSDDLTKTPDSLHLRVQRGKITAFDQQVQKDDQVSIEGFDFRYEDGSTWIGLEVWKRHRWILLGLSFLVLAVGLTLLDLNRRVA